MAYRYLFLVSLLSALRCGVLRAEADDQVRKTAWFLGASGERYLLKSGAEFLLEGSALNVQLGRAHLEEHWYTTVSLDIVAGPYQPVSQEARATDYQGTGISFSWGYNVEPAGIRTTSGNYGFSLGLSYADVVGRSAGSRSFQRLEERGSTDAVVSDYVVRVNHFRLFPALFFCWLEPQRFLSNKPEALVTRIEGYILTLGVALPLMATYQTKYKMQQAEPGLLLGPLESRSEHGRLRGYTIVISLTSLMGI